MIRTGTLPQPRRRTQLLPPCADCGAPFAAPCDEACPSYVTAEHEQTLAEVDAWEDHQLQDLLERRPA